MELENFYNNQVSFRLPDAMRERLVNVYPQISGTENSIPMKDFFVKVCEGAIEAIILKQEIAGYQAEISSLKAENKILAEKNVLMSDEINELNQASINQSVNYEQNQKTISELRTLNNHLVSEKDTLLDQLAGFTQNVNQNDIVISLTEPEKAVMNEITKRETERTKKQITPEIIFRDLFNTYMVKGASDVFPRIPDSDLAIILKPFKKQ